MTSTAWWAGVYAKRARYATILNDYFSNDELVSLYREVGKRLQDKEVDPWSMVADASFKKSPECTSSELVRRIMESDSLPELMQLGAAAGDVLVKRRHDDFVAMKDPDAKRKAEDYKLELAGLRKPNTLRERLRKAFTGEYPLRKIA